MGGTARAVGRAIDPTNPNSPVGGAIRDPTFYANPVGYSASGGYGGNAGVNSALGKGSSKGGEAPAVPDFAAAADQQTRANRPNQNGPFGSTSWTQDEQGNWTQNTTLTPGLNDAAQNIIGGLGNQLDPAAARDQAIQAAYGQATSRLDPQWQQREQATAAQLANQGLTPGSMAYNSQIQNQDRARNDAYAQAMYGAQTGAGNAAFGQSLQANQQPYQQLGALQGLTQQNSFMPSANLLGALGQQYAGQLQNYGIDQAGKNSKMQGGVGLGAAALPFLAGSDERLKEKIERLAWDAIPGVPFATWEWKHRPGERQLGVIAQDLEKVRPDLVELRDGVRFVNYSGLWEARHG